MKHNRLASPAPATEGSPGIVAIANSDEPIANSQHCRRSVATRLEICRDPIADLGGGPLLVAARGQVVLDGLVDAGGRVEFTLMREQ